MQEVYSITIIYDFILTFPLCAKDIIKLYGPDKNFRTYENLILYIMRYTFRGVNLFLAGAGQKYGRYLTGLFSRLDDLTLIWWDLFFIHWG